MIRPSPPAAEVDEFLGDIVGLHSSDLRSQTCGHVLGAFQVTLMNLPVVQGGRRLGLGLFVIGGGVAGVTGW